MYFLLVDRIPHKNLFKLGENNCNNIFDYSTKFSVGVLDKMSMKDSVKSG